MELNHSVFNLYRSSGLRAAAQRAQVDERDLFFKAGAPRSFQKVSFSGSAAPQPDHFANLSQRLDKLLSFFDSVKNKSPVLNETSAIIIERSRSETSTFSYSSTRDANGVVTEEFSFQIRYRPSGEAQFAEVATPLFTQFFDPTRNPFEFQRISENDAPTGAGGVKQTAEAPTAPVSDETAAGPKDAAAPTTDSVSGAAETDADRGDLDSLYVRLAGESRAFIERVEKLIEYYRLDKNDPGASPAAGPAPAPTVGGNASEPVGDPASSGAPNQTSANARDAAAATAAAETLANIIRINDKFASRISASDNDDDVGIAADYARRIQTGAGDDRLSIDADGVTRVNTGDGDDSVAINADRASRVSTGAGDDRLEVNADIARRINTGAGDDELSISADAIRRVNAGDGDDTLTLSADTIRHVDAGAGDDTITLEAEDAVIGFSAGGGEDVINVGNVGALGIKIDSALATSLDDIDFTVEDDRIVLGFKSGESLTINNKSNADLISVIVGGEKIVLQVGDTPLALDALA